MQDVPPAPHKVPGLGPQAARLDAGASASITISTPRHTLITPSSAAPPCQHCCNLSPCSSSRLRRAQDKEKVAEYKASIKDQLSRMGLIRGQPRQPWHSAGLSTASQPSTPGVAGPGPQTTLRRSMSARETAFRRDLPYAAGGAGAPYHVPRMTGPISGKPLVIPSPAPCPPLPCPRANARCVFVWLLACDGSEAGSDVT